MSARRAPRTFVTPFDREGILGLATQIDDRIEAATRSGRGPRRVRFTFPGAAAIGVAAYELLTLARGR